MKSIFKHYMIFFLKVCKNICKWSNETINYQIVNEFFSTLCTNILCFGGILVLLNIDLIITFIILNSLRYLLKCMMLVSINYDVYSMSESDHWNDKEINILQILANKRIDLKLFRHIVWCKNSAVFPEVSFHPFILSILYSK